MLDVSFEKQPEFYLNEEKCLNYLRTISPTQFSWPPKKTYFHTYTEIKCPKELLVIQSFLATQDLDHCELIVWSDVCIKDNPLLQPYLHAITLKQWDPIAEAQGTPLEGYDTLLSARDYLYWLQSDLLRLLVLYKYGGIWIDMDIIFLRDFRPILDQEFMYAWSHETDFSNAGACASVLGLRQESALARRFLESVVTTPPKKATTCWVRDLFAKVFRNHPFTVFPCSFFNADWCSQTDSIDNRFFKEERKNDTYLFSDAFSCHWHNSSYKDVSIEPKSTFASLEKRIHRQLEAKGFKNQEDSWVKQYEKALRLHRIGKVQEAAHLCETLLQKTPQLALAWMLYGRLLQQSSQPDKAIQAFLNAVQSKYAKVGYVLEAFSLLKTRWQPKQLLDFLIVQQERFCEHPEMQAQMGLLYKKTGNLEAAIRSFDRSSQLSPSSFFPYLMLGMLYYEQSRPNHARSFLYKALQCEPPAEHEDVIRRALTLGANAVGTSSIQKNQ